MRVCAPDAHDRLPDTRTRRHVRKKSGSFNELQSKVEILGTGEALAGMVRHGNKGNLGRGIIFAWS